MCDGAQMVIFGDFFASCIFIVNTCLSCDGPTKLRDGAEMAFASCIYSEPRAARVRPAS